MKLRRFLSCMMALLLVCSLPLAAFAEEYDLANGSITVTADDSGQYVTQEANNIKDEKQTTDTVIKQTGIETSSTTNTVTITATENATANVTIQDVNIVNSDPKNDPQHHDGEAAVTINVADGAKANVTLEDVNIDVAGTGGYAGRFYTGEAAVQILGNGDVTLELDGENTIESGFLRAGVEKNDSTSAGNLIITDENEIQGSLESTGGGHGAGIGGSNRGSGSNITITDSAEVTAIGGYYGAGIGGGSGGGGIDITIEGSAEVTAQGGQGGAGIGGGQGGSGIDITIEGSAEVTAKGGLFGAGIGGGQEGSCSNITVSEDAQVKAQGGKSEVNPNSPWAIGAGAAIGNGGTYQYGTTDAESFKGQEVTPNTADLDEGWIATYAPGVTDLDTAVPSSLIYKDDNGALTTSDNAVPFVKQEPTCTEGGYRAGFQVGNEVVGREPLNSLGHDPEHHDAKAPTCSEVGWDAYDTCKREGCTYSTYVEKGVVEHQFTNYVSNPDAKCGVDGTKTAKCDYGCKAEDTKPDVGSALTHSFTNYVSDGKATCTQNGSKIAECDNGCGATDTKPDVGTALGHSFTHYVSNNDATYLKDGTKTAKCDHPGCDATDTITDPGTRLPAPLYRVVGKDGKGVSCETERKNGILTITVEEDSASLTGYLGGIQALSAQGIDTIVFVTNGATSTFAFSDLMATMTAGDSYTLTHDGSTVTFTLATGTDISSILK